ncbi:MAG: hypothetical protein UV82_C0002G0023 [Candidatus Magasanikbacteria bacterium GW2011_GWD2_43_18]|uniref:26 kDa periplasmic immunogenic protein n=1 Tax=Candidatus Magasanikbacteria bacterium GW2011_GWE2_42_7 TaxID=1619052 RepID=A0A0G1BH38_9BACT|nr:MAG: hypothetical protein UV18_C0003G0023 [Candidatus Magasanikbacteria bacterium GW2011_GWC2_42_27]KKS72725.1 MAG: hypothetical protein UV42_C0005G0042 [Candidatus Magasanikbacteria bacterium GW2011_GWE2_42_7]KKT05053.1 MAG: hypothetical protein UV82_C0002G0023 [Candidatus Magasanikbacteria bacterium GW2011_GWD2_43_18]KKT24770.1 MAG: hypothetical protein UW10_C0020G0023 [Candidatus Magasanikbacteria bacterium GW2011_GWA2_43_9]HBB38325.1 hypothetical protein [Candidatus Magasanikbacteria bac
MPVSKKTTRASSMSSPPPAAMSTPTMPPKPPQEKPHQHMRSLFHGGEFSQKIFFTLLAILLVYVIFFVGTLIRNNIEEYYHIGQADRQERTITLDGTAKVTATPDIAMTTIGMVSTGETVAGAQEANTTVMNQLTARLAELGIASEDMQTTNYNIYPQYNYTSEEGRLLEGYEVSQSVSVKIRDLEKANAVIALAGEVGANNVSGLQFTIDERDVYLEEARTEALKKVYEKANALSQSLGVRIVSIVSYGEYETSGGYDSFGYDKAVYGLGGAESAPDIQSGSMDVEMTVHVTFEIR